MRSLRDDEHDIGYGCVPGAEQGIPGALPAAPGQVSRSGVGTASLRWKPPIDRDEVRSLLAYLRACLHREAVHTHSVRADELGSDACACLPAGPEVLFSGARETLVLSPEAARVMRLARSRGQAPRYGYPLVFLGEGADRLALPLLVVDVRAVDDAGDLRAAPEGTLVRAVGPPDVNPALLARLGVTDPEDLFELRTRLRSGAPDPLRRPAAVADLAVRVRALLARLEVERVDDIAPLGTRSTPRTDIDGAHNVAVFFRAGPDGRRGADRYGPDGRHGAGEHGTGDAGPGPDGYEYGPGDVESVLADLDPSERDGLNPDDVGGTALEPLLGRTTAARRAETAAPPHPGRLFAGRGSSRRAARAVPPSTGTDGSTVPIRATPLDQSQYAVLSAAMRDQLTVAAAPPGSGAHDLVDAIVRTAVGNGQRVLVCGRTATDIAETGVRADASPAYPLVRVGGSEHRSAEVLLLTRLLTEHAGNMSTACADSGGRDFGGEDPLTHWTDLAEDWARVREAWRTMDTMASGGHALAHLAKERARVIAQGWDPDSLFTPERGGPEYWLQRAERARAGALTGLRHRGAVRRELGVGTDPDSLARLCAVARMESEWRSAVDRRTRCAPLGELTAELADALDRHRRSSAACLRSVAEPRLRRGRAAIENRLETLNWHHGNGWLGLDDLLDALPAWMCRTDQVRALPPHAGLFDLVVVVGAERTRVAELLPALYRANRAVVFGDPAHPGPTSALEPDEERRVLATAGLSADQLDDRGLRHGTGSAMRALYRAAPPPIWLDEHDGAPPRLAEAASRHCYGGRLAVRTTPDPAGGPAFEWRDAAGVCEAAPGASYVNRDEAYRVAVVVDEIDEHLPYGRVVAVVAPTQPQVALIRRLLRKRVLRHEVRVGGPDLLACDRDAVDVTVLSPMLTLGAPTIAERRIRRMGHLWSSVLTRTRQRLVVVGDRGYWSGDDGPLGGLDAVASGACAVRADPAASALVAELRRVGTEVTLQQTVEGWTADMVVRFGSRRLLLLLDHEPDGRSLRHLLARGESLNRVTGDPVVLVPAWRCLADPRTLVEEILTAH
ncbi:MULTISPECIES: DEAD/DEAH box helicase family protein [Nocardiopsis]|uniref:DNA helicase n=1 Tax=Nocardiopsis sinuspersici TaxID=501010 RepID=A0A1V3C3L9_9ACTN|nr:MULTISPECIES: ATP-binding protein [Nocardiopsis]OOC55242.1 DNA helicase [Nocardiopsis sinuspersici]